MLIDTNCNIASLNNNIAAINNTVFDISNNLSILDSRVFGNSSVLQTYIKQNSTALQNFILQNSTVLDQRIYNNISILNSSLIDTKTDVKQLNNNYVSSQQIIQQQQKLIQNLNLLVQCLNNVDYQNISGQCYVVNFEDNQLSCSQKVYQSTFDISVVTHQVINSGNFSGGYVFSAVTVIQNAFIDVFDNVYSVNFHPLFQSLSILVNLKIQFGVQTLNSGSFISSQSSSITITQINIISRQGSQITINTNQLLNILANSPTGATINNILVNLSFALSSGNITLINNIDGIFNISGYQILGDYHSTLIVAMIGINVKTAIINVNQVSIQPNIFNVGNGSSYLFQSSVSTASILVITNLAIIIGSVSNFQSMDATISNYFKFGGLITQINSESTIKANNIIIDSYQKFSTDYVSGSGFLIGLSSSNNIIFKNICIQQNVTSTNKFTNFGLIGSNSGKLSIQNASITFSVQCVTLYDIGIVGSQSSNSHTEVLNLRSNVSFSSGSGENIGSIFGYVQTKSCTIKNAIVGAVQTNYDGVKYCIFIGGMIGYTSYNANTTIMNSLISNSNILGMDTVGGFFGFIEDTNTTIQNSSISNTNISGFYSVGGIIGMNFYSTLYLTNVQIQFVHISCQSSSDGGVVLAYDEAGTYLFSNSIAFSNFINNNKQDECMGLSNVWSVSGC
ncbi:Hypothetical_protein [Hexamita inflata]|uniref:Hypothetical_protein n=1 Tax=Hexamita inflata TaxID=28002 RepID=A0ABP1GWP6_9EUKA